MLKLLFLLLRAQTLEPDHLDFNPSSPFTQGVIWSKLLNPPCCKMDLTIMFTSQAFYIIVKYLRVISSTK